MDVAALSTNLSVADASSKASVSTFKKQSDQLEAVVGTILSGIEEAPEVRLEGQTGQGLNVKA
jgi:hypothetical protein